MSSLGFGAVLALLWVLLWGALTPANLLSGTLVAAVFIAFDPDGRRRHHLPVIRPLALVRLTAHLLRDLVVSNAVLSREVLAPKSGTSTGVIALPMPGCSDELLALLANFMALTPGTMPIEVRTDPTVMYVHVLHLHDVETVRRDLHRLRDLTVAAFGSDDALAGLEERG